MVVKDDKPWFLVEAKSSETQLSKQLSYFQKEVGAPQAFQVVFEKDFVERDCFEVKEPVVVPASTFLSQLV